MGDAACVGRGMAQMWIWIRRPGWGRERLSEDIGQRTSGAGVGVWGMVGQGGQSAHKGPLWGQI